MVTIHRFSKSQINMFTNDCPKRWQFRYLDGLKVRPSGAMKLGGSIHETAAFNFEQKADSHKDLPEGDVTDHFADNLKANLESEEVQYDEDENPGTIKDQGVKMIRAHHRQLAPTIQPESKLAVEQKIWQLVAIERIGPTETKNLFYTLEGPEWRDAGNQARGIVDGLEAEGRELELAYQLDSIIDVTDDAGFIRELKTKASAPRQEDADKLVDLSQYSFARRMMTRKVEPALALDTIVKNVEPKGVTLYTKRSREQLMFHLDRIGMMARAIDARAFVPHTDWYGCSKKFCGYWDRCAGKGLVTVDNPPNLKAKLEESVEKVETAAKAKTEEKVEAKGAEGSAPITNGGGGAPVPARPRRSRGNPKSDDRKQRKLIILRSQGSLDRDTGKDP